MTRVIFFQVRDPKLKLRRVAEAAQEHFERGERILLLCEEEKAAQFVDELLWKLPAFLPHAIVGGATDERVAITVGKANPNEAKVAFNLCPTPLLTEGPWRLIYDFEDLTSPAKRGMSELRFDAYKKALYAIEARP